MAQSNVKDKGETKTRGENEPFSTYRTLLRYCLFFDSHADYTVEPVFEPGRIQSSD